MTSPPAGSGPAATPIAHVIERMQALEASLPTDDGVACFNRMYLDVTQKVNQQVQTNGYADPEFMTHLDVVFAGRYFAAVDATSGPPSAMPVCWAPLFAARSTAGLEPVQFALAGMNAHINFDLPMAVVATCIDLGTELDAGSHHDDYAKVDSLLDAAEQSVRQSFESPDVAAVDRHVQNVLNVICNWNINAARDAAWDTAKVLWEIREHKMATALMTAGLAHTVAMVSRGLLAAV
ncbi:MAG: DUF5995 family protein [Nakamurella sp.]